MKSDDKKRGPGRPAFADTRQIMTRMPAELVASMDAALDEGEKRSDLIRAAIEREITRRSG